MIPSFRTFAFTLAATATLATLSPSAGAATLEFTGWKAGYETVTITSPVSSTVHAGEFAIKWNSETTSAFCIEITQNITNPGTFSGYTQSTLAAPLVEQFGRLYETHYASVGSDSLRGAAFQIAIWNLLNPSFAATGGSAAIALGQQWADDARNASLPTGNWQFFALTHGQYQDQLIASRVPVPATALLLGAGLLGIAALRRRDGLAG